MEKHRMPQWTAAGAGTSGPASQGLDRPHVAGLLLPLGLSFLIFTVTVPPTLRTLSSNGSVLHFSHLCAHRQGGLKKGGGRKKEMVGRGSRSFLICDPTAGTGPLQRQAL